MASFVGGFFSEKREWHRLHSVYFPPSGGNRCTTLSCPQLGQTVKLAKRVGFFAPVSRTSSSTATPDFSGESDTCFVSEVSSSSIAGRAGISSASSSMCIQTYYAGRVTLSRTSVCTLNVCAHIVHRQRPDPLTVSIRTVSLDAQRGHMAGVRTRIMPTSVARLCTSQREADCVLAQTRIALLLLSRCESTQAALQ